MNSWNSFKKKKMKNILLIVLLSFFSFSCREKTEKNKLLVENALKVRELQLVNIKKAWQFTIVEMSVEAQQLANNWSEWSQFIIELKQSPQKTIGSFQRKALLLVQKSEVLQSNLPNMLNKPQIKARLMAMATKLKTLHTYLSLTAIPEKKVIQLLYELNIEIQIIQNEIEEIIIRSHIGKEEGEQEMLDNLKSSN